MWSGSQKRLFCPKLGQEVLVTFAYPPHPFGRGFLPPVFDCASFQECEVGKEELTGTWTVDWNNCPLYAKLPNLSAFHLGIKKTRGWS